MEKARGKITDPDRLSNLPDVPLLHILSNLKAREAVQTCILSKRWRDLWAYIPSIHFDQDEFSNEKGIDEEKFLHFVNSFLILRKTSYMDSFRLHWFGRDTNPIIASTWIRRVAECNPRVIDIHCGYKPLEIPHSLFTCASIEVMAIQLYAYPKFITIKPKSVVLPCLRSLTLSSVALGNDFVVKLAQGCPILEEMVMECCTLDMSDIFSPVLRRLVIKGCCIETEMCISIPTLASLQLIGFFLGTIWLSNMSSLLKADVSFYCLESKTEFKKSKYELLSGLSNVIDIDLLEWDGNAQMRGLLAKELPKCPEFTNLKRMNLGWCLLFQDFNLIAWFIHLAPNLQKLILRARENFVCGEEESLLKDEEISKLETPQQFRCRQLKVKILSRKNERAVQELVKKLMENIKTLKKISIYSI